MTRRYSFPALVLILTLISLAIPESRRVMALQLRYMVTKWWAYPTETLAHEGLPNDFLEVALRSGTQLDQRWRTDIVRAEIGPKHDQLRLVRSALRSGQDSPQAHASALSILFWKTDWQRAEILDADSGQRPLALDADLGREMLGIAEQGSRLDPDNAFFDLTASSVLFGMHRDSEALARFHRAAGKPRYDAYRRLIRNDVRAYFRRSGMPDLESELGGLEYGASYSSDMRQAARMVVYFARLAENAGRHDLAEARLWDVVRIGNTLRRCAEHNADFLTGSEMQSRISAVDPVYIRAHPCPPHIEYYEELRIGHNRITGMLRSHGWGKLASYCSEQFRSSEAFRHEVRRQFKYGYDLGINKASLALSMTFVSSMSLQVSLVFFGLAVLVWLVCRHLLHIRPGHEVLGAWWKVVASALMLGLWAFLFLCDMYIMEGDWLMGIVGSTANLAIVATVGVVWPLLIWLAVRNMRSLPRSGEPGRLKSIGILTAVPFLIVISGVQMFEAYAGGESWLDNICPVYLLFGLVAVLFTAVHVTRRRIRRQRTELRAYAASVLYLHTLLIARVFLVVYFVALFTSVGLRAWALDGFHSEEVQVKHLLHTYAKPPH